MTKYFFFLAIICMPLILHAQTAKVVDIKFIPSGDSIKLDVSVYFSQRSAGRPSIATTYQGDTLIVHGYYILSLIGSGSGWLSRDTLSPGKWSENMSIRVIKIQPYIVDTFASPDDTTSYPPGGYILRSLDVKDNTIAKDDIDVFPNPTSHMLFIKTVREIRSIIVQDVVGKTIYTYRGKKDEIDLSAMPRGVYILQLETDKGTMTKKILKE